MIEIDENGDDVTVTSLLDSEGILMRGKDILTGQKNWDLKA